MDFITKMESLQPATLRLFKAIPVNKALVPVYDLEVNKQTIPLGFIISPEVVVCYPSDFLIVLIKQIYGLSGEQLNNTFHKSWAKVANTSIEQLVIEQLAHYCTTYGKGMEHEYLDEKAEQCGVDDLANKVANLPDIEMNKIWNQDYIYIPKEALEIPELTEDFKLVIIKGYIKEELKIKLMKLLNSGIALSETTIKDVIEVANYVGIEEIDLSTIKNKEVRVVIYDKLNKVPANPTEFLRFIIFKATGKTLLIKSKSFIEELKASENLCVYEYFSKYESLYGLNRLAEIFYRFKPIFLALRPTNLEQKIVINRLRRLAVKNHKPMPEDYLNNVTNNIKNNKIGIRTMIEELNIELPKINIFRKIRLAYALKFRTISTDSILYRIRNGKSYATDFKFDNNQKAYADAILALVLNSIIKDIEPNVNGKNIYIPDFIHYTLPATEKQFTGFFPTGTYVTIPKDLIFGIHWENVGQHQIDLDLATISQIGKFGWDGNYRNEGRSILFSGDITSAPKPKGATELFYIAKQTKQALILTVNYYNFNAEIEVPYKIIVASEHLERFNPNYMVNPNNVLAIANSKINQKQKILGLVVANDFENRFYFVETSIGKSITSSNTPFMEHSRKYLFDFYENAISLNEILIKAGAKLVSKEECEIDLSPETLEKDTIINLLIKE